MLLIILGVILRVRATIRGRGRGTSPWLAAKLAKMLGNEQTKRFCLLLRTCVVMGGVVCALLAACGQKGDLYLPADIPPAQEQGR